MNKSTELAVKSTAKLRGSFAKTGSRTWFAEDLSRCLHPSLNDYTDAKNYAERTGNKVFGAYCRHEVGQKKRKKFGKGLVYVRNGVAILTRAHESATENPLNNDAFIPCVSEEAALALEDALHQYFGKTEGVHSAVKSRVEIVEHRWLKPTVNSEAQEGGTELFDFEDCWDESVDKFTAAIEFLTSKRNVNKTTFPARYYQGDEEQAADLIAHWLLMGGDMRDFFLLMKPRAGKNGTMLLGLARYIKVLIESQIETKVVVDFLSLWPSAFQGCINDLKKYVFVPGINIEFVNTQEEEWQEKFQLLYNNANVHCIIRFASMQSIDLQSAIDYNNDEDLEGIELNFDQNKVEFFTAYPASIAVIDESDHGMRTTRSTKALESFGYKKCLWMSGTDLYAVKHLAKHGNHYLYDLFQEIQDVIAGKIERRPLMRKYSIKAAELPFESMDAIAMDQQEVSRRIAVLLKTNVVSVIKGRNWSYDKVKDRFVNANKDILEFDNLAEVQRLWDMLWFDWEQCGARSPESHRNVFLCMPSVACCLALYNHIREGDIECNHEPLIANMFNDITNIERDVTDQMNKHKKTVFITVGKMLRGAKAPWSAVVRLDDYSDFKVGLQLELRAQNTDEEFFDVYDSNPFRASSMKYEMIRGRTNGKKIDSEGRKLHDLIPMLRKGKFEVETVTWEDVVADWQAGSIREGYKRLGLIDETGVQNASALLNGVAESNESKSAERDKRAGKLGQAPDKSSDRKPGFKAEVDPLLDLKKRALTIAMMLPELVILTSADYSEIDDLINNTEDKLFEDWLTHCGIKLDSIETSEKRDLIIHLFVPEDINNQLSITCRKFKDDGFDAFNWEEFNRDKEGDVSTPESAVSILLDHLPTKFWAAGPRCLDPSCGTGEWVLWIANRLRAEGLDPKDYIHYADTSAINVRITSLRLGFDNGFCYNVKDAKNKEIINDLKGQFMSELGLQKFDLYATNPPFQKADKSGNDADNLWPSFLELGHQLTKPEGYMVMITPGSWASLGTNATNPGSKIRKKWFDTKQTELVDFTIGEHFDVGSTFTGYVIKNTENDPNLDTVLVFKDNIITGKFADYPCFSLFYSNSEFIDIVKKFRASQHYDIVMDDPYHTPRAAMPKKIKQGDYSETQGPVHPYRVYHTNAQDTYYSKYKNKFHDQWKAVFSYSGSWKVEVTDSCSLTDASMCILTDTKEEAESVQSVLQSAPVKFLIDKVFRWGGYYNGLFISWIPALPMTKIYTEEEVYKLLFATKQAELIQELLLAESSKKTAKKQASDVKKQAKASALANKPKRVKKVKS
jgi:type I restriction-modification system DNA methylase subunit